MNVLAMKRVLDSITQKTEKKMVLSLFNTFMEMGAVISGRDLLHVILPNLNQDLWDSMHGKDRKFSEIDYNWNESSSTNRMRVDVTFRNKNENTKQKTKQKTDSENLIKLIDDMGKLLEFGDKVKTYGRGDKSKIWIINFGDTEKSVFMKINILEESESKSEFESEFEEDVLSDKFFLHQNIFMSMDEGFPSLYLDPEQLCWDHTLNTNFALLEVITGYFRRVLYPSKTLLDMIETINGRYMYNPKTFYSKYSDKSSDKSSEEFKREKIIERRKEAAKHFEEKFVDCFLKADELGYSIHESNIRSVRLSELREAGVFGNYIPESPDHLAYLRKVKEYYNNRNYDYDYKKQIKKIDSELERRKELCDNISGFRCVACDNSFQLSADEEYVTVIGSRIFHKRCRIQILLSKEISEEKTDMLDISDKNCRHDYGRAEKKNGKALASLTDEQIKILGICPAIPYRYTKRHDDNDKAVTAFMNLVQQNVFNSPFFKGSRIYGGFLRRFLSSESDNLKGIFKDVMKGDIDIFVEDSDYIEKMRSMTRYFDSSKIVINDPKKVSSLNFRYRNGREDMDLKVKFIEKLERPKQYIISILDHKEESEKEIEKEVTLDLDCHTNSTSDKDIVFDAFPNVLSYKIDKSGCNKLSVFSNTSDNHSELTYLEIMVLALTSITQQVYLLNMNLPSSPRTRADLRLFTKSMEMEKDGWSISYDFLEWNSIHCKPYNMSDYPRYYVNPHNRYSFEKISESDTQDEKNMVELAKKTGIPSPYLTRNTETGKIEKPQIVKLDLFMDEDSDSKDKCVQCCINLESLKSSYCSNYNNPDSSTCSNSLKICNLMKRMVKIRCGHTICFKCLFYGKDYLNYISLKQKKSEHKAKGPYKNYREYDYDSESDYFYEEPCRCEVERFQNMINPNKGRRSTMYYADSERKNEATCGEKHCTYEECDPSSGATIGSYHRGCPDIRGYCMARL